MLSADVTPPPDRPNLSKDYLAGNAKPDWIPLRGPEFYQEQRIDLVLNSPVSSIDASARSVRTADGRTFAFGAMLLATGAEPVRLKIPGADGPRVHYLRSQTDSEAIIASASDTRTALVIGASFIGLEVAASLRTRGLTVHVVAPESRPMERVLGAEVGQWVQALHESHGVNFHLGRQVTKLESGRATLSDGSTVEMDITVIGIGVQPRTDLAAAAGLRVDRGIVVNEFLETSTAGIFAAGDVARWPDPRSTSPIRVEHWVVAERQGQAAARNMLGARQRFDDVPFFWSQHYDWPINYVGHAEGWDSVKIDGRLADNDWAVSYLKGGKRVALATVGRDRESLEFEAELGGTPNS
jgi:NADPH-dependent 2,4-dienoyl-CoA reductase/sulfur reductase-like enzyme